MDDVERFAKQIKQAYREIGLGTDRQLKKYIKDFFKEQNALDANAKLKARKFAEKSAWIIKICEEGGFYALSRFHEIEVYNAIASQFSVVSYKREGFNFIFKVEELDDALIIEPNSHENL